MSKTKEKAIKPVSVEEFFSATRKTLTAPSGVVFEIKKVSASVFLAMGELPIAVLDASNKAKGIVRDSPEQVYHKRLLGEIETLENKIGNKKTPIDEVSEIYKKVKDLRIKLLEIQSANSREELAMLNQVAMGAIVSPAISSTEKEGFITPGDISKEDLEYICVEIMSFSGLKGEGAETLESFRGEEKHTDNDRSDSGKIQEATT